jgi:hypothetical protein
MQSTLNVNLETVGSTSMKIAFRVVTEVVAASVVGAFLATQASAGCPDVPGIRLPSTNGPGDSESGFGPARFIRAGFIQVWAPDESQAAPIVGLWSFKYTSKGNLATLGIPDGAPIDGGLTTWFADGNESSYSGVRNPIVGAVCHGVWKQTGENTYELNHIGLSWDPQATSVSPPPTLPHRPVMAIPAADPARPAARRS